MQSTQSQSVFHYLQQGNNELQSALNDLNNAKSQVQRNDPNYNNTLNQAIDRLNSADLSFNNYIREATTKSDPLEQVHQARNELKSILGLSSPVPPPSVVCLVERIPKIWGDIRFAPTVIFENLSLGGQVVRAKSAPLGNIEAFLAPNSLYGVRAFDPATGATARTFVRTNSSGSAAAPFKLLIASRGIIDTDADGLTDVAEEVLGTQVDSNDTDGDGLNDFIEIQQGLDPLGGRAFPTGVVASLPLLSEAKEVVLEGSTLRAEEQTTYVATGSHGLAIVNASQFQQPVVLRQLDLSGDATDVAVDSRLGIAVVASGGGGLHFVDVSNPSSPSLIRTINVQAGQVEVVDGVAYVGAGANLRAYDLLTGEKLQDLALGGYPITGLVREGSFLYSMDSARTLRAIDLSELEMVARGSLTLTSGGGGKLFVGNGIAYVAAGDGTNGGFATVNVSDPDTLTLASGVDATNVEGTMVVANGSGLAVAVGTVRGPRGEQLWGLDVLDVTDPTDTGGFLTRIDLPAAPYSVALGAGIAFVADGTGGLQVVNYLSFDHQGQAPSVGISTSVVDVDPALPGTQVVEGSSIPIRATVADDVQVRNVELLVDGVVVFNDVSFPFDLQAVALGSEPGASTVTVQVRATDTGGNSSLSDPLVIDLVPDTFGPTIFRTTVPDGGVFGYGLRRFEVEFSEPIGTDSINLANFQLLDSEGNPVEALDIQARKNDRIVQVTYEPLPEGNYQFVVDGAAVTDRAGNAMEAGKVITSFTLLRIENHWVGGSSSNWNDPANWSRGQAPGQLDDVFIEPAGNLTIHLNSSVEVGSLKIGGASGTQTLNTNGFNLTIARSLEVKANGVMNVVFGSTLIVDAENVINRGSMSFTNASAVADLVNEGMLSLQGNVIAVGSFVNTRQGTLSLFNAAVNAELVNAGLVRVWWYGNVAGGLLTNEATGVVRLEGLNNSGVGLTLNTGMVNRGVLELTNVGSETSDATLVVAGGELVNEAGGVVRVLKGGRDDNGPVVGGGGRRYLNGPVVNRGMVDVTEQSLTHSGGNFANSGQVVVGGGRSFSVGGDYVQTAGSTALQGGTLVIPQATLISKAESFPGPEQWQLI